MKKSKANIADKIFVKVLGGEKWHGITIPLFSVVLALLAGTILFLLLGKNPITAFASLLQGSGILPKEKYAGGKNMLTDFVGMVNIMVPMIFASLAVAVAFKGGLFNIGVSGQMMFAGFIASITIGYSELPMIVALPLALVIGALSGALCGGLIGLLKYKFNINEVVSSIMLNYTISYVISFFIFNNFLDPVSRQSKKISDSARFTLMNFNVGDLKMDLPLAFVIAIIAVFCIKFMMDKTKLGYEIKAVGASPNAARFAGISVGKTMITSMVFSGMLAGLAGVSYYMGYLGSIQPKVLSAVGFDAIAVSLLGNSNPIGILFAALLITVITKGSTYMTSTLSVPVEIASVITGLLLLFSACGAYISHLARKSRDKINDEKTSAAKGGEDK